MNSDETRAALASLLRSVFQKGVGSRPRRYLPSEEVLDGLGSLARQPAVQESDAPGPWRVVEGRRWLLNRRLDGRSVPLVQREQSAIVARSWLEAREIAAVLNWGRIPAPPRVGLRSFLAAVR